MFVLRRPEAGSSLIESMIAFVILGSLAAAIYPAFIEIKKTSRRGDVRQICADAVRAKLDEYRFGRVIDLSSVALAPKLRSLTMPTQSQSSTGVIDTTNWITNPTTSSGFMYSKIRYNENFPFACNAPNAAGNPQRQSQATLFTAQYGNVPANDPRRSLGMRECLGLNAAAGMSARFYDRAGSPKVSEALANADCNSDLDRRIQSEIPGFKLYVKLELNTSWQLGMSGGSTIARQYSDTCPDSSAPAGFPSAGVGGLYDFNGAGDSILITVTGIMDVPSMRVTPAVNQTREFAGIKTTNIERLMCTAKASVSPTGFPVRYYLSNDGRIYPVNGLATNVGGTTPTWAFASLYNSGAGRLGSGILSFAVHPRNLSIYVLKPGVIVRYGKCGGVPIDCTDTGGATGLSDSGQTGWPDVQQFFVSSAIKSIALDFRDLANVRAYGLSGNGGDIFELRDGAGGVPFGTSAASNTLVATDVAAGTFPKPVTWTGLRPSSRIRSFFIDPGGEEAFLSDMSGSGATATNSYGSTIYRISDFENLSSPIITLPVNAVSFSR